MMTNLAISAYVFFMATFYPLFKAVPEQTRVAAFEQQATVPDAELLYQRLGEPELPFPALVSSLNVYRQLVKEGRIENRKAITIIDYNKPSRDCRLFVIDPELERILFKSLVAHGKNSGENYATSFSNNFQSHQSSLGFYLTGDTYVGRHGYSLILDGLEKGINDNAKKRAVVIHGASYVSQQYLDAYGRLGRSFGCPALPVENARHIIDTIRAKSLLFIYSTNEHYRINSSLFNSFLSSP